MKIVKYVNGGWVCVLRLSKRTVPIDKKYKNDIIVLYNQWLMYEKFRILIVTKKEFRKRRKMLKILLIIYIVMELLIFLWGVRQWVLFLSDEKRKKEASEKKN